MQEPRAQRTLVKSPPELWAEVSDVEALARHLGEFGEIRITRLDPETTVAWEGDRACGTVALEPAGWGTKGTITAKRAEGPAPGGGGPQGAHSGQRGGGPPAPSGAPRARSGAGGTPSRSRPSPTRSPPLQRRR